jgi:hypothetical protein
MAGPTSLVSRQVARPRARASYRIQVLDRTLNLLNVLGEAGESLGPAELASLDFHGRELA